MEAIASADLPISCVVALSGAAALPSHAVGTLSGARGKAHVDLWSFHGDRQHLARGVCPSSVTALCRGTSFGTAGEGELVVSGHSDGHLRAWRYDEVGGTEGTLPTVFDLALHRYPSGEPAEITSLSTQPGTSTVLALGMGGQIHLVDLLTQKDIAAEATNPTTPFEVVGAHWTSPHECLVVCEPGQIYSLDTRLPLRLTGRYSRHALSRRGDPVTCSAMQGRTLVFGTAAGEFGVMECSRMRAAPNTGRPIHALAVVGDTVVAAHDQGRITETCIKPGSTSAPVSLQPVDFGYPFTPGAIRAMAPGGLHDDLAKDKSSRHMILGADDGHIYYRCVGAAPEMDHDDMDISV